MHAPSPAPPARAYLQALSAAVGLLLILFGVAVLAGNGVLPNWWALFIAFPGLVLLSLGVLWLTSRAEWAGWAGLALLWPGLILLAAALVFLFNQSMEIYWPLLVLLPGLAVFSFGLKVWLIPGPVTPDLAAPRLVIRSLSAWFLSVGLGAALLGLGFLLQNLGVVDLSNRLPDWWTVALFAPAVGGLWLAAQTYRHSRALAQVSLLVALTLVLVALIPLMDLSWNLLTGLILIGAGILYLIGLGLRRV